MALIGVLVGLFLLGVVSPAGALPNPCVQEEIDGQMFTVCPYQGVGAFGTNAIGDFDFSRCNLANGCVDFNGVPCSADGACVLKAIPPGWCSEGTNSPCIWPEPVGRCTGGGSPSLWGCVETADCPSGESCTGTVDTSCQCTNDRDPVTGLDVVCGGTKARCSDGDNSVGAFGTGLCIDLVLGDDSDFSNCGEEAGRPLSGPRWQVENPGAPQTPQRTPGSGFLLASGPIVETNGTFALAIADPDPFGVRRMFALGYSNQSDWSYSDKAVTESIVNSHIITYSFDTKVGWETQLPIDGRCVANTETVCIQDSDCGEGGTCNPETFVYGSEAAINAPYFLWTADVDPNNPSIPMTLDKDGDGDLDKDCPPLCGLNYFLSSFEEEMIREVGGAERDLTNPLLPRIPGDQNAGVQLSLNVLLPKDDLDPDDSNGWAGEGDLISVNSIVSLTWLPASDMRCSYAGNPERTGICGDEKQCVGGAREGELCSTISDCGGRCEGGSNEDAPCSDSGDCEGGGTCVQPTTDAFCVGGIDEGVSCKLDKECRSGGICPRCLNVDCDLDADPSPCDCVDKKIGRCSATETACSPFTEINTFNKEGSTDDCRTTGVDDSDTFTCQFCGGPYIDPNAPQNTCRPFPDRRCIFTGDFCFVDDDCPQFTTGRSDILAAGGNLQALPIGYNDHGLGALGIIGRTSGINGLDVKVRVPLFILGVTGAVALEFRDNDGGPELIDRKSLGPIQTGTGGRGIGEFGGTFANDPGLLLPGGGTCCDTGADIVYPPVNPGTPEGPLALAVAWGSGDNQIPGCVQDNDPAQEPTCQFPLGVDDPNVLGLFLADPNACFAIEENGEPVPGCNTGLDDDQLTASIGGVELPAVTARRDVSNPTAKAPTLYYVAAGSARDLDVAGSRRNADALFKVDALLCPLIEVNGGYEAVCCSDPTGQDANCTFDGTGPTDTDGDGVPDDGDGSGVAGDNLCADGVTSNCDDNCLYTENNEPGNVQKDANGDLIGDSCQCGDVSGDGVLNTTDALLIARGQVTDPVDLARCDVNGDAAKACNTTDALIIARGQAPATPGTQTCPAYVGGP